MSNPSRSAPPGSLDKSASSWCWGHGRCGSCLAHVSTAALFFANVPIGESGVGGDDFHEAVCGVTRQMDFVQALPYADTLLSAVQARRLCGKVDFTARGVFGLLVHEPRPEIHCQVVRAQMAGSSEGLVGLVWYHDTLRVKTGHGIINSPHAWPEFANTTGDFR
jgi:hypothetical protein